MNIYWVGFTVNFNKPISVFEDDTSKSDSSAYGFFQEIGCTSDNEEETKQIIVDYLSQIPWFDLALSEIVFDRLGIISMNEVQSEIYGDPDIKDSLISDPLKKGIWYASGRAFYSDEMSDDEYLRVEVVKKE